MKLKFTFLAFLLSVSCGVQAQSCCDFDSPKPTGGRTCFYFPEPWGTLDVPQAVLTGMTLDAAGEKFSQHGFLYIDGAPTTTKTCSTAACTISFRTGAVTWNSDGNPAASTLIVSLQDLNASTGGPTIPDETADVSFSFVEGTTAISANTWTTTGTMTSGTKTVSHGDPIAIVFDMSVRDDSDSVVINVPRMNSALANIPSGALKTSGTWAHSSVLPNAVITFDDGTLGWIDGGAGVTSVASGANFNVDSALDEYGNFLKLPFPVEIDGLWAQLSTSAGGDYALKLTGDPLVARTALRSKTGIDGEWVRAAAGGTGPVTVPIPKVRIGANYPIGVSLAPETTNNVAMVANTAGSSTLLSKIVGGNVYGIAAADGGAFSANGTNVWWAIGIRACAVSNTKK